MTTHDLVRGTTFDTIYAYGPMGVPLPPNSPSHVSYGQIPVEATVTYKGISGNVLKTMSKGWFDPYELGTELTTLDDGSASSVCFQWGPGHVIKDKQEFDFGQITSTSCPTSVAPVRETVTTYQSFAATSIFPSAPSILDRPSSVQIKGNGTLTAETDYAYDGTAVGSVSSLTQHDETNYSPSYNNRGNVTTKTVKCLQSCTNAVTTYTNDETGKTLSMTDPNGNLTSYSYADSFLNTSSSGFTTTAGAPPSGTVTNAYLTKITEPMTNSIPHVETFSYGYNDGELTQSIDQNSQPTTYRYNDVFDRHTETDYPDSGQTNYAYNDSSFNAAAHTPNVTETTLILSSTSKTTTTANDGMGHGVYTSASDPDGADTTETAYDGMGRMFTKTNPHRSSLSSTDGIVGYTYDALGRITEAVQPDGSDIDTNYSGKCSNLTDEAGNLRRSCSDSLGRLTEVDEPGSGSTSEVAGSGTVNISGSEQVKGVASPGQATVTVANQAVCYQAGGVNVAETGQIEITINGIPVTEHWGGSCSGSKEIISPTLNSLLASFASALTSSSAGVNASVNSGCTSTSSSCQVTITAKTGGSSTNYPFTTSYSVQCTPTCPTNTGVIPSPASSALAGGTDTTPDTGTVIMTVNGTTNSTSYGPGWTAKQVADTLFAGFQSNPAPSVSVSEPGTSLIFTAQDAGVDSNYAVSTAVNWNGSAFTAPSFTACLVGVGCPSGTSSGSLTGGKDSGLGSTPLVTLYTYDALDNLLTVQQKGGTTDTTQWRNRTFAYDSLSRLTSATNPESGTITYTYDANGNLTTKVVPKANQTTTTAFTTHVYTYDALNRLVEETHVDPTQGTELYAYDGGALSGCFRNPPAITSATNLIGRRSAMCGASPDDSSSSFSYDKMGRVVVDARTNTAPGIATQTYSTGYAYYADGSLHTLTYPSGAILTYTVGSAGRVTGVSDGTNNFVAAPSSGPMYAPSGLLLNMRNGSSIQTTNTFNSRLQPVTLKASTTATFFSLSYDFHLGNGDNGNVFQIVNNLDPTRSRAFQYDALNRLTQAHSTITSGTNCWGEVYTIDSWGNLTNRSGPSGMTGCGTEGLSQTANVNNQLSGMTYDAAGNVRNDGNGNMPTYDSEDRIETDQGFNYSYDADGVRIKKSSTAGGTLYWPDVSGDVLTETDLNANINEEYVFFNGSRVARIDRPSGTPHYYFSDHLGSHTVVTNANGQCEQDMDFYPYGGVINDYCSTPVAQHYKFTGKERDSESNLDNFGARYYTSNIGRFMTPDWAERPTAVPYAVFGDPQSLNLYTYVRNDPVTRADLDGHSGCDPAWCSGLVVPGTPLVCMMTPRQCGQEPNSSPSSDLMAQNPVTPQSLRDQIPADVRANLAGMIKDSNSPTADDKTGGFHEEYAVAGTNASGDWVVSRDKPGPYSNPDTADHVSPSGKAANQEVANSIVDPRVVAHVHPDGVTAAGNSWRQPPSPADRAAAVPGQINIVFGARDHKVYFYNNAGDIGKPMKLKDFLSR